MSLEAIAVLAHPGTDQPSGAPVGNGWFTLAVASRAEEAEGIFSYDLVSPGGGVLPPFEAGAHLELKLGEHVRQYSLFNAPADAHRYRIAVKREASGRGGSAYLCDRVRPGDRVSVRGPRQAFGLGDHAHPRLLVAGGIGITPILAMAEHLAATGQAFEFHYLARSRSAAAFAQRLLEFGDRASLHLDDGPAQQRADLAAIMAGQAPGTHVYICGPGPMIDAVVAAARAAGIASDRVHFERFAAAPVSGDQPFEVLVRSSGRRVLVGADQTVVQALAQQANIHLPVSCEAGVCGTCVVRMVSGEADHRDMVLTEAERAARTHFVPCCSRARSACIELDL